MNRPLAEFVQGRAADINELPLIHSARCERIGEIARTGRLEPQICELCSEPLIYFFYGRPAFKAKCVQRFFPVCFVFKPFLRWPRIAGIYPFDSGAAVLGKFDPYISSTACEHYELESSMENVKKLVRVFFETNEAYYHGTAKPGLCLPLGEREAQSYYDLLRTEGNRCEDDRRMCIEVQFSETVFLKERLSTVILPASFLEVPEIRTAVYSDWRVDPLVYDAWDGTIPFAFKRTVLTKLREHLRRRRYL